MIHLLATKFGKEIQKIRGTLVSLNGDVGSTGEDG
jgi:hypothetical protein